MTFVDLPPFFNYREEKVKVDAGYEALQDFFISWTIRLSETKYNNLNPKLNEYARKIVYGLIFCETLERYEINIDDFKVDEVEVFRQYKTIDLIAIITYTLNNKNHKVVLNIENKWYSNIGNGQLEKCRNIICEDVQFNKYNIIDIFLSPDWTKSKEDSSIITCCVKNNYKMVAIEDLKEFSGITKEHPSGNYMFDEYWTRFYQ